MIKKLNLSWIPLLTIAIATPASAVLVNVDFGANAYTGQGAIADGGNTWNDGLNADGIALSLVDSNGAATGVGYTIAGLNGGTSSGNEGGEFTTHNNLIGDFVRGTDNDPATHIDLTITGLTSGGMYTIALYAVQNQTFGGFLADNRGSIFTIDSDSKTSSGTNVGLSDAFTEGQTHVTYLNIIATGGTIDIDIDAYNSTGTGNNADGFPDTSYPTAFLNAFQIQEVVPEPSSTALLGLGGLALLLRRRK